MPVRVWVSYESMARGKSGRNHQNHMKQRTREGFGVVRVYEPWEIRTKCYMKLQSTSRAHTGKKLENMWVIP